MVGPELRPHRFVKKGSHLQLWFRSNEAGVKGPLYPDLNARSITEAKSLMMSKKSSLREIQNSQKVVAFVINKFHNNFKHNPDATTKATLTRSAVFFGHLFYDN